MSNLVMKRIIIILKIFLLVTLLSSPSYGKWTKIGESEGTGNSHYVDFERIKKKDGFVYFWNLSNYTRPIKGISSEINFRQADCTLFRYKILSGSFHNELMGRGSPINGTPDKKWRYAKPYSVAEMFLESVCNK